MSLLQFEATSLSQSTIKMKKQLIWPGKLEYAINMEPVW